jgi:ABC-2 type transport system permease protein
MQAAIPMFVTPTGAVHTLSRPVSPFVTAIATVVKGLQITRRYLPNLVGIFAELCVRAFFFYLMASAISLTGAHTFDQPLTGRDLFIFFQCSLLIFMFTRSTLWGPLNAVNNDLYNGTLEYLYSNPGSRYAYYVGTVLAEMIFSVALYVPLYLFLAFYSQASLQNMALVLLASTAVVISLTAMGIMVAILALLWRQVGAILQVLGILFEMLAGAYLPVKAFPQPLQYLSYLLPFTWGYDLIRYYSFGGRWQTILPVWAEWAFLAVYAVLYTLVSRYLLGRAELVAKRTGLHVI